MNVRALTTAATLAMALLSAACIDMPTNGGVGETEQALCPPDVACCPLPRCPAVPHGTTACDPGGDGPNCDLVRCNAGWGDCDLDPTNGCETPLNTKNNCGGCGVHVACCVSSECPTPPNGTAQCVSNSCTFSCTAGFTPICQ
jgi:hypothetical protein